MIKFISMVLKNKIQSLTCLLYKMKIIPSKTMKATEVPMIIPWVELDCLVMRSHKTTWGKLEKLIFRISIVPTKDIRKYTLLLVVFLLSLPKLFLAMNIVSFFKFNLHCLKNFITLFLLLSLKTSIVSSCFLQILSASDVLFTEYNFICRFKEAQ